MSTNEEQIPHWRKLLYRILDVADDIVAILIAIVLIVRYSTQTPAPSLDALVVGILSVLTLLAISGLRDRVFRFRNLDVALRQINETIESKIVEPPTPDRFFLRGDEPDAAFFSSANKVDILGITLGNTTRELAFVLGNRLAQGAIIRMILLGTSDEALNQLVLRSWGNATPDYYRKRLETSLRLIEIIAEANDVSGSLSVGTLPFIPSFGIKMIDSESGNGRAFIEVYHHGSNEPSPAFYVTEQKDPYWFRFFRDQFTEAWKASSVRDLRPQSQVVAPN